MIAQMSDSDLAKQLKSLKGEEVIGPITPNTRPVYERRLMKYLILEQASSCTIPYTPPNTDDISQMSSDLCHTNGSVVNVPHGVSNDGDVYNDAADSAVYFGVQLQSDAPQSFGEYTMAYISVTRLRHTHCYKVMPAACGR